MADNLKNNGEPDRSLISLKESWEVAYWTKRFNVTEAKLRKAINQAGSHSAAKVEQVLKKM